MQNLNTGVYTKYSIDSNTTEKMYLAHPELGYDTTAIFD